MHPAEWTQPKVLGKKPACCVSLSRTVFQILKDWECAQQWRLVVSLPRALLALISGCRGVKARQRLALMTLVP